MATTFSCSSLEFFESSAGHAFHIFWNTCCVINLSYGYLRLEPVTIITLQEKHLTHREVGILVGHIIMH